MYVDTSTVGGARGKTYTRHLLRESYREGGKVKHRTVANISHCSPEEIEALRLALRHKHHLRELVHVKEDCSLAQGLSVGAVGTVSEVARRVGITHALGSSRAGKLALWQVIARVIGQGSRLSAVRLAGSHAACDLLNLARFNEEDLYQNLDWLREHQEGIEDRLFERRRSTRPSEAAPQLFLYDVTSSYLEGTDNELGAFGYNRDKKQGKRQIVIGLLCDQTGTPVSIEVFPGNTRDAATFGAQLQKVATRFGGGEVTFVGDRGMIKSEQIEALHQTKGFHYITAITKPQIKKLLQTGVIQLSLFDQHLAEVETTDGIRYILRRNPFRAAEVAQSRENKLQALMQEVERQNRYLREHPRAQGEVARRKVHEKIERLRLSAWVREEVRDRHLVLIQDHDAVAEERRLDGCYVLKTDLAEEVASKETVHDRYKDLALVEQAFRTSKTTALEVRPVHVRTASHTRGHVLVVMLAYLIIAELRRCWQQLEVTVTEGIRQLETLCTTQLLIRGTVCLHQIPQPRGFVQELLTRAQVTLPQAIVSTGVRVTTKKKLSSRRRKS